MAEEIKKTDEGNVVWPGQGPVFGSVELGKRMGGEVLAPFGMDKMIDVVGRGGDNQPKNKGEEDNEIKFGRFDG